MENNNVFENVTNNKHPPLSGKQADCVALLKNGGLRRINILQGAVRSGKTHVSLLMWVLLVSGYKAGGAGGFLMAGKTLTTLKRNCLEPMTVICGERNFSYSLAKKEGRLFGKRIYLEGVSDTRSEGKIRGLTLDGAYCDELSLFDEDFFAMLLSRLSNKGAKLIATTNPDHPSHWLKKNYLDHESVADSLLNIKFTIDDNVFLPADYVAALKREYRGVYYDRFIRGLWVAAEGRIYPDISGCILKKVDISERLHGAPLQLAVMGVDYGGNKSASVFMLTGFDAGWKNIYVLAEYYDSKNKSAEHLISAFREKCAEWKEAFPVLRHAYCDSAEQLLVKSFRAAVPAVGIEVKNALKRPINMRISMLSRLISSGRVFISGECVHFIEAVENAVWDERRASSDIRLDDGSVNVDSLDAFEYCIERYSRELFLNF